jgi:hypothetical protein
MKMGCLSMKEEKVGSHIGAVIDEGRLDAKEIVKRWSQSFTL